jgi:hypothetical protein
MNNGELIINNKNKYGNRKEHRIPAGINIRHKNRNNKTGCYNAGTGGEDPCTKVTAMEEILFSGADTGGVQTHKNSN